MLREHEHEYGSGWAANESVAGKYRLYRADIANLGVQDGAGDSVSEGCFTIGGGRARYYYFRREKFTSPSSSTFDSVDENSTRLRPLLLAS
jgi:hypothetical protein